jgi:hypothetical protein
LWGKKNEVPRPARKNFQVVVDTPCTRICCDGQPGDKEDGQRKENTSESWRAGRRAATVHAQILRGLGSGRVHHYIVNLIPPLTSLCRQRPLLHLRFQYRVGCISLAKKNVFRLKVLKSKDLGFEVFGLFKKKYNSTISHLSRSEPRPSPLDVTTLTSSSGLSQQDF